MKGAAVSNSFSLILLGMMLIPIGPSRGEGKNLRPLLNSTLAPSAELSGSPQQYRVGSLAPRRTRLREDVTARQGSGERVRGEEFGHVSGANSTAVFTQAAAAKPFLKYSSYLGSGDTDNTHDLALDAQGNAYVVGVTESESFPASFAVQSAAGLPATRGTFVSKLKPDGSGLLYSTLLGDGTAGLSIAVDRQQNVYVTGAVYVDYFPATSNAFQRTFAGEIDAFVVKLAPDGTNVLYATYLGGSDTDYGRAIAVDHLGNAYVVGLTRSTNFPTQLPLQGAHAGFTDLFVAKLSPDGSRLEYSTYLGGALDETPGGISVDAAGHVYVTGSTGSSDFPVANALPSRLGGTLDAVIAKLDPTGSRLLASTYFGGTEDDGGLAVALDPAGNVYVTGFTASSTNFPLVNPVQPRFGGETDSFVAKLNSNEWTLNYSTFLGGSQSEAPDPVPIAYDSRRLVTVELGDLAVDAQGRAHVTGHTPSPDFPLHQSLKGTNTVSGNEVYVAKLNAAGSGFIYSTILGGAGNRYEDGHGIAVDQSGIAWMCGSTAWSPQAPFFPSTPDVFQSRHQGGFTDGFVASIGESTAEPPNDQASRATPLRGARLTILASNSGATAEAGESSHAGNPASKSVWWTWTAPATGVVTLTTLESDFDTVLAVYRGETGSVEVASNDDLDGTLTASRVTFPVASSNTYRIVVDGKAGAAGTISLSLILAVPPNDDFIRRIPIEGFAVFSGSNVDATAEPNEPEPNGQSVWWTWTSPVTTNVTVTTEGSTFRAALVIYTGDTIGNLTKVADLDTDPSPLTTRVSFKALANTAYQVLVDGVYGAAGQVELRFRPALSPPNDDFANGILISELPHSLTLTNTEATSEPEERLALARAQFFESYNSLWWSWRAPTNSPVLITTTGSSFDTRLFVFTGTSLSDLLLVTNNDNFTDASISSRLLFNAVSNTVYYIALDSGYYYDAVGVARLNMSLVAPPQFVLAKLRYRPPGPLQLQLRGTIEQNYIIEASTNLANWTGILTNRATNGLIDVTDPQAGAFNRRYYRAIEAP